MLLLALVLALATSCGGGAAGGGDGGSGENGGGMKGMDHGGSGKKDSGGGMKGMDHGDMGMGSGGMAKQMVMENGKYSDEAFIDAMVPHHQGAVDMARVALKNADHEEIEELARNIVSSQEAEIGKLKSIKKEEFGTSKVPMHMSSEQMRAMGMMTSPQELARSDPFDKAFIDAMIPHHQSAIEMANVALKESKNPQIRELAQDIVSAQEREIKEMKGWRKEWYPGS